MRKWLALSFLITILGCSDDEGISPIEESTFLGELAWMKNFGGSGEDTAQAVVKTSDGGYAILGYTNSTDGDIMNKSLAVNDYWLLKLDADGNLLWSKTYGGSKDDRGQSVIETGDGGFAIVGYAMSDDGDGSNNEGFHDNWILRLDATGNILWEKSFGFSGHDHSYDVVQTADGGFFFAGFLDVTQSGGEGNFGKGGYLTRHGVGEFWGTKLDAQGNLQWRRYFGGTNNDRAYGVVVAHDGGFVMAGASESDDFDITDPKGSYDFWVVKVDKNGTLVWQRSLGGSGIDIARDITKTADGGYMVVGHTFSVDADVSKNNGESDVWLVKLDDNGNMLWQKTFGGSEFDAAESISPTIDGGFLIAGNAKSNDGHLSENNGENDLWLMKTDGNGNLVWQQTYGGSGLDYGFAALENEDGSIVLVGETQSADIPEIRHKGATDLLVLKVK
ncbi:hypothetical protein [Flagellimonas lutaonensis]|uniref:Protein with an N-terminal beta-propellor repeat domain protein n=1 Tax=Flagellimonas lutaonensis TaxID=516051 RepID=A0A0D5YT88_9FLAO|nr:hypothetical protein [Allomuricauda lutaonensis]AKA35073.1 protein with an N-terminal beta-propellor repeat domain protein [Allomuricauda lutaonensis]